MTKTILPVLLLLVSCCCMKSKDIPTRAVKKNEVRLADMFGVNAFEWDFLEGPNHVPFTIYEPKIPLIKSFTQVRHYLDWSKIESMPGKYTFNPAAQGGWNYDAMYERCKTEGVTVLTCFKTCPDWLLETYPAAERDYENVPAPYGSDHEDPASYLAQAKAIFQYAARYGNNKGVDPSLLSVNTTPRWTGDSINKIKIGLSLIQYIECDNERDKWWKGAKAHQTAREYAANLSAFYDGHKGSLGKNAGAKTADPAMKVVMGGLASADVAYVREMIEWCREKRGYKADGSVNLCFDIINYHYYSNDAVSPQAGKATRGVAPELSNAGVTADNFMNLAEEYAGNMPVWVTEVGYDINAASTQRAVKTASRTIEQTQADWLLRTSLLYARHGVSRLFFYQLYDVNKQSSTQYSSSGLADGLTRRLSADYIAQAGKLFGSYIYKETLNRYPMVDVYVHGQKKMYVLFIPDETGKTEKFTLDLKAAKSAIVYHLQSGSDAMKPESMKTINGKLLLTLTETPVFVEEAN